MFEAKERRVIRWGIVIIELIAALYLFGMLVSNRGGDPSVGNMLGAFLIAQLFVLPAALTFVNVALVFFKQKADPAWKMKVRAFEIILMVVGVILSALWISFVEILFVDWSVPIAIGNLHTPVWTEAAPTAAALFALGLAGYLVLAFTHAKKTPPLVTVLAISAMYIGAFECALWSIQVSKASPVLMVLPLNCILIAARLIRGKALELKAEPGEESAEGVAATRANRITNMLAGNRLPVWALVLAFPLLGAVVGALVLCGQRPDAIIKGYTETADWVLSQQVAPPGYDQHYLCTVAAQGHRKLVKPLRAGRRHGRPILVNRQLCVANAFEQVLEERAPRLHRAVRGFYDAHGYPLSRLIRTKAAADAVYLLMKPLEWLFLATLYLVTINPEERIARQYQG
ncbi:MAG: hypothetical protein LBR44_05605 [Clostridiales Family XIII bacterium]|jgi:hypothetical protein|nr:hypothetical protein [Clostridiales Family XIII bacterium]